MLIAARGQLGLLPANLQNASASHSPNMQLSRSTIGELSKKKQIFINISRFLYKHLVNKTFAKKPHFKHR